MQEPNSPEVQTNPAPLIEVEVRALEGQLKVGRARQFTVMCDEGPRVAGTDTAPPPLSYFTLGIAF